MCTISFGPCHAYDEPSGGILRLTCILVYRFLLDLQEAARHDMKLGSDHPLHFSGSDGSLSFARAIGSIGATIAARRPPSDISECAPESLDSRTWADDDHRVVDEYDLEVRIRMRGDDIGSENARVHHDDSDGTTLAFPSDLHLARSSTLSRIAV